MFGKKADDRKKIWEEFRKKYSSEFSEKKLDEFWNKATRDYEEYQSTPQTVYYKADRFGKPIPIREYDLSYFLEYRVREERERREEERVLQKKSAFITEWLKENHDPTVICCVLSYLGLETDEILNENKLNLDTDIKVKIYEATQKQNKGISKCLDLLLQMSSDSYKTVLKLTQEIEEAKAKIGKI